MGRSKGADDRGNGIMISMRTIAIGAAMLAAAPAAAQMARTADIVGPGGASAGKVTLTDAPKACWCGSRRPG